jgi:CubicO group peptidase (beta-lactamase class C family)
LSLDRAPAVERSYSNLGYALLGIVVTRRSGKPYEAFVIERILAPLGMVTATFDPARLGNRFATPHKDRDGVLGPNKPWPHGAYMPVGGLYASARELGHYINFQLSAWPPRDDPDSGLPCSCQARSASASPQPSAYSPFSHAPHAGRTPRASLRSPRTPCSSVRA